MTHPSSASSKRPIGPKCANHGRTPREIKRLQREREAELRERINERVDSAIHTVSFWVGVASAIYVAWCLA